MIIIEALILTVLLMVLIFCSYTDCRDSLIRNSALLKAGLIIGTLDIVVLCQDFGQIKLRFFVS